MKGFTAPTSQRIRVRRISGSIVTGDAVDRSVMFRLPVTIDTPAHIEGVGHLDHIHSVDLSMTFRAVHASLNMGGMTELNVVGHVVNFDPLDGTTFLPVASELLDMRAIGRYLGMTVHAGIDAGDRGMRAFTRANMAVATGDFVDTAVELVAEGKGLFGGVSFPGIKTGGKEGC